jgi:hypothetical protein
MLGQRPIWAGRAHVCRSLYHAAFTASQCNPNLKARVEPIKIVIFGIALSLSEHTDEIISKNVQQARSWLLSSSQIRNEVKVYRKIFMFKF